MNEGLTALAAAFLGSVLTLTWLKAAERRKDRGVRRQIRSMLRLLLRRCVYQAVGGPVPTINLAEYGAMVDGLLDRATKEDVPTALSDCQADAFFAATQELSEMRRRVTDYRKSQGVEAEAWFRLPKAYRPQQESEIALLSFALITLGDDYYVDFQVPESIKTGSVGKRTLRRRFWYIEYPPFLHKVVHWNSRKKRWRSGVWRLVQMVSI